MRRTQCHHYLTDSVSCCWRRVSIVLLIVQCLLFERKRKKDEEWNPWNKYILLRWNFSCKKINQMGLKTISMHSNGEQYIFTANSFNYSNMPLMLFHRAMHNVACIRSLRNIRFNEHNWKMRKQISLGNENRRAPLADVHRASSSTQNPTRIRFNYMLKHSSFGTRATFVATFRKCQLWVLFDFWQSRNKSIGFNRIIYFRNCFSVPRHQRDGDYENLQPNQMTKW